MTMAAIYLVPTIGLLLTSAIYAFLATSSQLAYSIGTITIFLLQ